MGVFAVGKTEKSTYMGGDACNTEVLEDSPKDVVITSEDWGGRAGKDVLRR